MVRSDLRLLTGDDEQPATPKSPSDHPTDPADDLSRATGTALAWKGGELVALRALSMARLLVVARLLLPEAFGLFAIAQVVVGTLSTLTDVGMVPALVQRRQLDERHRSSAWTVGILRGLAIAGLVALFAPAIASLFGEPTAAPLVRWLGLRPLLEALLSIRIVDLQRSLRFRGLFFLHVPGALVETLLAIGLASRLGAWALVAGVLAGGATQVVLSYLVVPWRPRLAFDRAAIAPLIRFGRWIFASQLVAVAGGAVLQAVVSRRLGTEALGLYYLGIKLAFLPAEVASEVVGRVAFPLYARLQASRRHLRTAFARLSLGTTALLWPAYALLFALAPWVPELLGERWQGTVPLLRWLAVVGAVGLFGDLVVPLLRAVGRPARVTALEAVQSTALISLAWWLAGTQGLVGAGMAWLVAVGSSQLLAAVFLLRALGSAAAVPAEPGEETVRSKG